MKLNKENGMKWVFFLAALTSVLAVALICVFLFAGGLPAMTKIGLSDFIFGQKWKQHLRHFPDDYGKYLCHGNVAAYRCTDWAVYVGIYGFLLS